MMNGNGVVCAVVLVGFSIVFSAIAHAESKYNPYTRQWEDVSSDAVPQICLLYTSRQPQGSPPDRLVADHLSRLVVTHSVLSHLVGRPAVAQDGDSFDSLEFLQC